MSQVHDHTNRPCGTPGEYAWGQGRKLDSRGTTPRGGAAAAAQAAGGQAAGGQAAAGRAGGLLSGRGASGSASSLISGARLWNNPADGLVGEEVAPSSPAALALGPGTYVCGGAADGGTAAGGAGACRIQVKGSNGQVACMIELPAGATLASVHAALLGQAVVPPGSKYELRTAFPSRTLTEPNATLSDLGLVPSATLCVRLT